MPTPVPGLGPSPRRPPVVPVLPTPSPGALAFGSDAVPSARELAPGSSPASGRDPQYGTVPIVVSLDSSVTETDEFAALQGLRRSAEALFDAIEARLAEATRRTQEAEAVEVCARQAQGSWEQEQTALRAALEAERVRLRQERDALEEEKARMAEPSARQDDILSLNLGGERVVQRRRSTLCAVPDSFLAARFSGRWEHELDRDKEGRYFVNYSPELFLPLLDYLGLRETEDPTKEVQLPKGPENSRPQFQAMLRYFGMLPAVSVLEAVNVPYESVTVSDHGVAFEIMPKKFSLFLVGLETCAGTSSSASPTATIYTCQGALLRRLRQKDEWRQAAVAQLKPCCATRIEFAEPIFLQAKTTHCVYIATNSASGVACGAEARCSEVIAENEDLQIHAGRTGGSPVHFSGFEGFIYWFPFNGKLEYTLADGL